MEQMAAAVDVPQQCFRQAAMIMGGDGATGSELYKCQLSTNTLLNGIDARTRKVAERLLRGPIMGAWQTIIRQTQVYLQDQWNASVMVSYKRKISDKFPFYDTTADASLNDIADFFRPEDGLIWAFTDAQLKPFLRKTRNNWVEKTWLGAGIGFDKSLLRSLRQATQITSGLFRRGQIQPDIHFSIYPMPSTGVQVTRFETNGQHLVYQNEPQEWKRFSWPGDQERSTAVIGCIPSGDRNLSKMKFAGDWSLLRLLHQADMSVKNGLYHLVWHLKTDAGTAASVQLKLRPDRHSNIFADGLFSRFRLPSTIF
jgi:type VI secretion system protein ImpL